MKDKYTIFYSWQSDLPNKTNRGFIEDALKRASKLISKDIDVEIAVDRDTKGVAGAPEIHDTIFDKIRNTDIFVADISIINKPTSLLALIQFFSRNKIRLMPNPNVLIELGYALSELGENRIILIHNSFSGKIEHLPFDINKKRVISYELTGNCNNKHLERDFLVKTLNTAISKIIEYDEDNPKKGRINVKFGFADIEKRQPIESVLNFENQYLIVKDDISDYVEHRSSFNHFTIPITGQRVNNDFYREIYDYYLKYNLCKQINFYFSNKSTVALTNIKIDIIIPNSKGDVEVYEELPTPPARTYNFLSGIYTNNKFSKNIASIASEYNYTIKECKEYILIEYSIKSLQPSRTIFLDDDFFIGSKVSQETDIKVEIRANELPKPIYEKLLIIFNTEVTEKTSLEFERHVNSCFKET